MRENVIERTLRQKVEQKGGLAIKLAGTGLTGIPDRLILMPGARVWFVETKTATGVLSPRQKYMAGILLKLGFPVTVIRSREDVNRFIENQNTKDLKNAQEEKP